LVARAHANDTNDADECSPNLALCTNNACADGDDVVVRLGAGSDSIRLALAKFGAYHSSIIVSNIIIMSQTSMMQWLAATLVTLRYQKRMPCG
jgi:hypothetical protein